MNLCDVRIRLALSTIILTVSTATVAHGDGDAYSEYRCDQNWPGPGIVLRGVVLPLPKEYSLIDRTSLPHVFANFSAIMDGRPPGEIHVGFAPDYENRQIDDKEFRRQQETWKEIRRERLVHVTTGSVLEFFWFSDGVMMEFSGAALPYSELVASCYLELLPMTVEMNASEER